MKLNKRSRRKELKVNNKYQRNITIFNINEDKKEKNKSIFFFFEKIITLICAICSVVVANSTYKVSEQQTYIQKQLAKPILNFSGQEDDLIKSLKIENSGGIINVININITPYLKVDLKKSELNHIIGETIQVPIFGEALYKYKKYGTQTKVVGVIEETKLASKLRDDLEKMEEKLELLEYRDNIKVKSISMEYVFEIIYTDMFEEEKYSKFFNCSTKFEKYYLNESDNSQNTKQSIIEPLYEGHNILKNKEEMEKLNTTTGTTLKDSKDTQPKALIYNSDSNLDDTYNLIGVISNIVKEDKFTIIKCESKILKE